MKQILVVLLILGCMPVHAQKITKKPDFVKENETGEVVLMGVYTTDDSGYVVRYDLFGGDGKLLRTSIPYYARDGRILEARDYDADGNLLEVAVFIGNRVVGLTPGGEKIENYDEMNVDMEGFLKHFRSER